MRKAEALNQHPFTSYSYAMKNGELRLPLRKQWDAKDGSAEVQE